MKHGRDTETKAVVLGCMDYRIQRATLRHIVGRGQDSYQFILAGAALGYMLEQRWGATFDQHVAIATTLSKINTIVIIQHADCGYFRSKFGDLDATEMHSRNVEVAREAVSKMRRDPQLSHIEHFYAYYLTKGRGMEKIELA